MTYERESKITDHFTLVPHGLWTAPISWGAKSLLGWLHSHDANYLAKLTSRRIISEMGASGQVTEWIRELVEAGYLSVISPDKSGKANRFVLKAGPWEALATRARTNRCTDNTQADIEAVDEPYGNRTVGVRESYGRRTGIVHIEEQGEHQREEQQIQARDITRERAESDDWLDFWKAYPRSEGKVAAQRAWRKMSAQDRADALAALPVHAAHWRARQIARTYIPHASTWLNGKRWQDDLGDPAEDMPLTKRIARFALEADKLNAGGQT